MNPLIWAYQKNFQDSAQADALSVFKKLDEDLNPKVFLIGISIEKREDSQSIILEPENCRYAPDLFLDIKEQVQALKSLDEPFKIEYYENRHKLEELRIGVQNVINQKNESQVRYFSSWPMSVKGYLVFTVLQLSQEALNRHYSLTKNKVNDRYSIQQFSI